MNRQLLLLTLAAAGLAACTTDVPTGACTTDDQCQTGTICDPALLRCVVKPPVLCDLSCLPTESCQLENDVPKCVAKSCAKACGEGFLCQQQPDASEKCLLKTDAIVVVTMLKPAANQVAKAELVTVECEAKAPQFVAVTMTVSGPGVPTVPVPTRRDGTDIFETTFDAAGASVEDAEYTFNCEVEYGPAGETLKTAAAPTTLKIDTTAPGITHTANTDWHARSETVTLVAELKDEGTTAQGLNPDSVKARFGDQAVAGVRTTGDTYAFPVVLAAVKEAGFSGSVSYTIEAADKLGHPATPATGSLQIDDVKPTVALASDGASTWRPRGGGAFNVTATVTNPGEGADLNVSSVKLSKADGTQAVVGTRVGTTDEFLFTLDPALFSAADTEGAVGWKLVAADAVGNAAETTGTFNIDGKAPVVTITPNTAWTNGSSVVLSVQATDGGHGVNDAEVKVTTASGTSVCAKSGAAYQCTAGINTPVETFNAAYAVTVDAKDASGNSAQATTTLKVDKKKPTLSFTADGKVYARTGSIIVRAKAVDAEAGLAGAATPTVVVSTGGAAPTVNFDSATGDITITVLATVAPAGAVTSVNVTVQAFDAVGNAQTLAANGQFKVDDMAPVVSLVTVTYPASPIEAGKLLRRDPAVPSLGRDKATVTATVVDQFGGAGVEDATVFLKYPKKGGGFEQQAANAGSPASNVFTWTFDASTPEFNLDAGNVTLGFAAADKVGNAATGTPTGTVAVTRKLWAFDSGRVAKVNGGVAVTGGKVYYTLNSDGLADNVFAVNAATGTKSWSAKVLATPTTPISVGGSKLYFGSDMTGGTLNAFDLVQSSAIGVQAWACSNFGTVGGALSVATVNWETPTIETVFYPTGEPRLRAVRRNASNTVCETVNAPLGGLNPGLSSVSHANGRVFFGGSNGGVSTVELNATFDLFAGSGTSKAAPSGFGTHNVPGLPLDTAGNPFYIYPNFAAKLTPTLDSTYTGTTANFSATAKAPGALGGDSRVYFGADTGYLFGFDTAATTPAFEFPVRNAANALMPVRTTPAVGQRIDGATTTQTLYFAANDSKFRAITTAGVELWSYTLTGDLESSPAIDCKGVAYFGTNGGQVHALVTDSQGPANSSWPRFQHDNKNTGSLTTPIYTGTTCVD